MMTSVATRTSAQRCVDVAASINDDGCHVRTRWKGDVVGDCCTDVDDGNAVEVEALEYLQNRPAAPNNVTGAALTTGVSSTEVRVSLQCLLCWMRLSRRWSQRVFRRPYSLR